MRENFSLRCVRDTWHNIFMMNHEINHEIRNGIRKALFSDNRGWTAEELARHLGVRTSAVIPEIYELCAEGIVEKGAYLHSAKPQGTGRTGRVFHLCGEI
jgi:predicted ArsR family transcriptional regulator